MSSSDRVILEQWVREARREPRVRRGHVVHRVSPVSPAPPAPRDPKDQLVSQDLRECPGILERTDLLDPKDLWVYLDRL